jgi:ComF family protein
MFYLGRRLLAVILPDYCWACGGKRLDGERVWCLTCELEFPICTHEKWPFHRVDGVFRGRFPFQAALAWSLYFEPSGLRELIHTLKYEQRGFIGLELGRKMGEAWLRMPASTFETPVNAVIPVPIHRKKKRKRGYNQSERLARGFSEVTGIPVVETVLERRSLGKGQSKSNRLNRWLNVQREFRVRPGNALDGGHVLLMDDVITTGATIESCAIQLQLAGASHVSVLAVGYTSSRPQ